MSADLQWLLVKNNSRYLVRRNGTEFSMEEGNLMNRNTFKFNGLVNSKTVDVNMIDGRINISLKRSKNGAARKPASAYARSQLNKHMRNKSCRGAETVTKLTSGSYYRGDLTKFAVARYHALNKAKAVIREKMNEPAGERPLVAVLTALWVWLVKSIARPESLLKGASLLKFWPEIN